MAFRGVLVACLLLEAYSYATWNITEMHERFGRAPSCTKAVDKDWKSLDLLSKMKQVCKTAIGCSHDVHHINVNADDNPYHTCITQGEVNFQGLKPTQGTKQVNQQQVCNHLDRTSSQQITLAGSDGSTVTVATTNTASFSEEISVEVSVPMELKVTTKNTFGFSSAKTNSQSDSSTRTFSNTVTAEIPPHECVCAKQEANTLVYDSTFTVPVCLSGYFRCDWKHRCHDHHYWYITFEDYFSQDDLCYIINGKARSNQDIKAFGVVDPGMCPSKDATIV